MAETNTPRLVDAAGECLLYYEIGVHVLGAVVLNLPDLILMRSKSLKLKEIPNEEMP